MNNKNYDIQVGVVSLSSLYSNFALQFSCSFVCVCVCVCLCACVCEFIGLKVVLLFIVEQRKHPLFIPRHMKVVGYYGFMLIVPVSVCQHPFVRIFVSG